MPRASRKPDWRVLYLILAMLTVFQAGCLVAAVGLVGGGAMAAGYAYCQGWSYHEFAATLDQASAQTHVALAELHMPILEEKPSKNKISLVCRTGDDRKVKITLENVPSPIPSEGFMTRIWVRVPPLGDKVVSTRILDQISMHLPTTGMAPPPPIPVGPPGAIQPTSASHPGQSTEPRLAPLPASPIPVQQPPTQATSALAPPQQSLPTAPIPLPQK